MRLTNLFCCCTPRATPYREDDLPPKPETNRTESEASLQSTAKAKSTRNTSSKSLNIVPYTPTAAADLFATYADPEDPSVIGPEGFERLCNDVDAPLDGALPLILSWLFKATEMAKISKAEWDEGTATLQYVPALSAVFA